MQSERSGESAGADFFSRSDPAEVRVHGEAGTLLAPTGAQAISTRLSDATQERSNVRPRD